jgi:hypothetical protein
MAVVQLERPCASSQVMLCCGGLDKARFGKAGCVALGFVVVGGHGSYCPVGVHIGMFRYGGRGGFALVR